MSTGDDQIKNRIACQIVNRCKKEIALLFAVGGVLAVVLFITSYYMMTYRGIRGIYSLLVLIGFFGPIIYFYRASERIKKLRRRSVFAAQGHFSFSTYQGKEYKNQTIVVSIEDKSYELDYNDIVNNSSVDASLVSKFDQDILVNRIHAIAVIILTLVLCTCSVVCRFGMIRKDFYDVILAMPLGIIIAVSVIFPMFMIARNSDIHFVYILWLWIHIEGFGSLYLIDGENKVLRIIVSSVMLASMGFIIWFMNKDLINIRRSLCNDRFRHYPATVIRKIGVTNREHISPVAFGYLTVEVEDQNGKAYKVKVRSSIYDSILIGDSGTMIMLDEDSDRRLFIV